MNQEIEVSLLDELGHAVQSGELALRGRVARSTEEHLKQVGPIFDEMIRTYRGLLRLFLEEEVLIEAEAKLDDYQEYLYQAVRRFVVAYERAKKRDIVHAPLHFEHLQEYFGRALKVYALFEEKGVSISHDAFSRFLLYFDEDDWTTFFDSEEFQWAGSMVRAHVLQGYTHPMVEIQKIFGKFKSFRSDPRFRTLSDYILLDAIVHHRRSKTYLLELLQEKRTHR